MKDLRIEEESFFISHLFIDKLSIFNLDALPTDYISYQI